MKESLYKRIARELVQSIASGKYPVGTLLPPEMELCEQFDVSRHTIREALRDITEQGLIVRRKGIGTLIVEKKSDSAMNHPLASLEDLLFLANNNLRVVKQIDEVVADEELSQVIAGFALVTYRQYPRRRRKERRAHLLDRQLYPPDLRQNTSPGAQRSLCIDQ